MASKYNIGDLVIFRGNRIKIEDVISTKEYHLYRVAGVKEAILESQLTPAPASVVPNIQFNPQRLDVNLQKIKKDYGIAYTTASSNTVSFTTVSPVENERREGR